MNPTYQEDSRQEYSEERDYGENEVQRQMKLDEIKVIRME